MTNFDRRIGRYESLEHKSETMNIKNIFIYYYPAPTWTDGLSNLKYNVILSENREMYKLIVADV